MLMNGRRIRVDANESAVARGEPMSYTRPVAHRRGFQEMHIRLLFLASVLCIATYGCETTPTDPKAAAEPREEPTYTTGSRLPSSGSASVQGASRGAWEDDRRNSPGSTGIMGR